jgi:chorismate mutase-like protein
MRNAWLLFWSVALFAQSTDQALESSRQRIDSIDDRIVTLLNERAQVVREAGLIKKKFHAPASAPGREEQVMRRVSGKAQAPLAPTAVEAIYRSILHEMSAMEAAEMEKESRTR